MAVVLGPRYWRENLYLTKQDGPRTETARIKFLSLVTGYVLYDIKKQNNKNYNYIHIP